MTNMKNFTQKKTNLNTKVDFSKEKLEEPFIAMEPKHVPVDNQTTFEKMFNRTIDQKYICTCEYYGSYFVGSIKEIELWIHQEGIKPDEDTIEIYELKSDKPLSFNIKTTIEII